MLPERFRRTRLAPRARLMAVIVCSISLAITPAAARAQVFTTVEFSFSNPGARSLGFGGAFVALADDATAAFANPAGLVQLNRPELSIEGRAWTYSSPYTVGGRAAGAPTGIGIDTVAGPVRATSEVDLWGLSFVSLVFPRGRWSVAFYQHQLQNFEMVQEIQGLFIPGPVAGASRGPIERGFFDFEITARAVAVGYRASDRMSVGLGLANFDSSGYFVGSEYLPDADTLEAYFAPATFLPERRLHTIRARLDGNDWGLTAGFLWSLSPRWKLGGAYREGRELPLAAEFIAGPASPELPPGSRLTADLRAWASPDVHGLGAAFRSRSGRWTGSLEWNRVGYSIILDSADPALRSPGDILEDADELHLGGEYAFFAGRSVVALRAGAWLDPDHQIRNVSAGPLIRAETPGGEDELHLAAGFGLVLAKLQIDLGIDLSERRDAVALSLIYGF